MYNGDRILERKRTLEEAFAGLETDGPGTALTPDPTTSRAGPGHRPSNRASARQGAPSPLLVAYSVKANPNLAVLELLARDGAGADIVSGGELYRALRAGIPAERIVFAGVGKSADELRQGIEAGIMSFHVESAQELDALGALAAEMGAVAPVAVRVNPDVQSFTHEFTSTGHAAAKFGVSPGEAHGMYRCAAAHPALRAVGVDVHIGSQIRDPAPFLRALDVVVEVAERARRELGIELGYVDLGGGFGISDGEAGALDVHTLGREVADRLRGRGLDLILEPGRFLVGDAGVLITCVLYVKQSGKKTFVVTDAGMTELIRPSHYGGVHSVSPVRENGRARVERVDVVGPVCEQGDFLARDRPLPLPRPGALLSVHQAGAYGFTMASNYNSRPRPAEVLVHGEHVTLARRRERYDDLIRGETDD
ncbi:MAG: diaminopimelate decarboxylase [Gemmatimonadota bacterium]|nr:diaminopimelate decarboxylase [Gemmatimonadota bacterium]MDE2983591.1 diaminopimelate decarboxylase [Gemmatimonadota bacterium]